MRLLPPAWRVPAIDAEQLAQRLAGDDPPLVLDVRTHAEYRWGHVPGARWVSLRDVLRGGDHIDVDLDRGSPIVAVCLAGHRSDPVVRRLRDAGYDAVHLDGGMRAWWANDYPTLGGRAAVWGERNGFPLAAEPVRGLTGAADYRRALEALTGVPATDGNRVDVLRNGVEIFPAMLDALRAATRTIDVLTYVYWTGPIAEEFADTLRRRARDGLRVRVLLDAVGASKMDRDLVTRLRGDGAHVEWFRPPLRQPLAANHRTHRKILLCDDRVGFSGGVGIAREWEGDAAGPEEWRDTHVRVEGPAVASLRSAFLGNWIETGSAFVEDTDVFPVLEAAGPSAVQVLKSQSAASGRTDVEMALRALVRLARERLLISTAYFTPDRPFLRLLRDAARRGVDVEVLVPGPHVDKRVTRLAAHDDFGPLLDAGIRIHEYEPTMLHTKVLLVDGLVACVGSANVNARSLSKDDEVCLLVHDADVVAVLERHFREDRGRSREVQRRRWHLRGALPRISERLAGVVDPQL